MCFLSACRDFLKTRSQKSAVSSHTVKTCQVGQLGHVNNKERQTLKETSSLCAQLCSELINFLRHSYNHPFGTVNLFEAVSWMIAAR